MLRLLLSAAVFLMFAAGPADAQYMRGQIGTTTYIYPAGTLAYNQSTNGYRSGYYYLPPVNYGYYGPRTYGYQPSYRPGRTGGYYVAPNGNGGGGYYSYVPNPNSPNR